MTFFRWLFILTLFLNQQVNANSKKFQILPVADSVKFIEKVYLHTDRDSYYPGDDIPLKNSSVTIGIFKSGKPHFENVPLDSPKHHTTLESDYKPDLRTTLFWEPNIKLENNKDCTLNYYNADNASTVKIVAEGITSNGIPVTGQTEYQVR